MILNTLDLDRDALREALLVHADDGYGDDYYSDYLHLLTDQHREHLAAVNALDALLQQQPANATRDGVDMTLVASGDGGVEGYEFTYDVRRADARGRLLLRTSFILERNLNVSQDGLEGLVDFLEHVVSLIDEAILTYNEYVVS